MQRARRKYRLGVPTLLPASLSFRRRVRGSSWKTSHDQPVPKYHAKGCSRSSVDSPGVRDAETAILIKFAFWRGLGRGNFTENCPKTLFVLGNSMTIKFGNFTDFIVRNLLSFGRLLRSANTGFFAAFESFSSCEFRASIARAPFCAVLWRSPT